MRIFDTFLLYFLFEISFGSVSITTLSTFFKINTFACQDGDKFWRMPECYIRGSTIKYLRIPDEVIDMVKEDVQMKSRGRGEMKGRGGQNQRGGRGGGRGKN